MPLSLALLAISAAALVGGVLGWFLRMLVTLGRRGSVELEIKEMMLAAREAAERLADEVERESQNLLREARAEAKKTTDRLAEREDRIAAREASTDRQREDLDARGAEIDAREAAAIAAKNEADRLADERRRGLEALGQLSAEEARLALRADLVSTPKTPSFASASSSSRRAKPSTRRRATFWQTPCSGSPRRLAPRRSPRRYQFRATR
jgi:hypothetical protein